MKFQYTEAALQELQSFQTQQRELLEQLISERKFVFGDEIVEVTASDIKEASRFIRADRPRVARYSSLRSLSQIYAALGALIAFVGYFYPSLQNIFVENRVQGMAIITGLIMMALGGFSGYLYRLRIRRYEAMHSNDYEIVYSKKSERADNFRNEKDSA